MTWGVQMKLTEAGAAVAGALVVEVHRVLGRIAQLGLEARKQVADELIQVHKHAYCICCFISVFQNIISLLFWQQGGNASSLYVPPARAQQQ